METDAKRLENTAFEAEMLQGVSRSFALTIPQLPSRLRGPVTNGYFLCRIIDTIEDEEGLSLDQKRFFFDQFVAVTDGNVPPDEFAAGLHPLLSRRTLPAEKRLVRHTARVIQKTSGFNARQQAALRRCVRVMAGGMQQYQEIKNPFGLKDLPDLNRYCYYVAGVVGELLTELFCEYSSEIAQHRQRLLELAPSFGQGLQMTNILKDIWDDRKRGACWLPRELFRRVGFELENLVLGRSDEAFEEGIGELVAITRCHLANALTYTMMFPRHETGIRRFCLWAIGMAVLTLRKINMRRDYRSGAEVKISRPALKRLIGITNAVLPSNLILRILFSQATRDLPPVKAYSHNSAELAAFREDLALAGPTDCIP